MPNLPHSVHLSPFDYADPAFQNAAPEAKSRSRGHCQECGRKLPLEAHHWALVYPPAGKTTADDLTALCRDCHDGASEKRVYLAAGGSPERLRAAQSEAISDLLRPVDDGRRVGWAVRFQRRWWAAIVTGQSRPCVGEVFWLFLFWSREWRTVAVTKVVDGRPGHWRVRKRFLGHDKDVRLPAANGGGVPAAAVGECATPRHDENVDTTSQPAVPHMLTASTSRDSASACRPVPLT
ncbi:MAG: HNH endonuclease [Spirochaetaceae bacterium]|nr:HNH endonuclease [Spirochaetaceae bacterium]